MRHARSRTRPAAGDSDAPGFGAVTIDFNPAPDADERLRRLFSILLEHTGTGRQSVGGEDHMEHAPASEDTGAE